LNFEDQIDLPVQFLRRILNELKNKRDLNQEYLQLLDLNVLVCKFLADFIRDYSYSEDFIKRFQECWDILCFDLEDSQDSKSFLLHQILEFFTSRLLSLDEIKSNYAIGTSLGENLIYGWLDWMKGIEEWGFLSEYAEKCWRLKEKNVAPAKILLMDLVEFIGSEKSDFVMLPQHLRTSLIYAGHQLYKHQNILGKSELEKIYLSTQNLGLEILQNLKKGVTNEKKTLRRFISMLQLVLVLINRMKDTFQVEESGEKFIKEVFESKLVEGFIEIYEENKSLLQKTGDVDVIEAVWELFSFVASCASKVSAFFSKERNLEFLKSVLQDSCGVDPRLVSRGCYEYFAKKIQSLFESSVVFAKSLKDEKLLFGILRIFIFSPFTFGWESDVFAEKFCQAFSADFLQERTFLHLFSKFIQIFESAMRDPSVDLYDAMKKFEESIEDEKKNCQEKIQQQQGEEAEEPKEEEETSVRVPFLADRKAQIKNFESLNLTAGLYCNRTSFFVYKILSAFKTNLEKMTKQVEPIIRRYTRMGFDPLFVFAWSPSFIRTWRSSMKETFYMKEEMLIPFMEGAFAGIVEICKEFKFNEYDTLSKFDSKRLCQLAGKISAIDYLRRDDIPEDITYEEAALLSFIVGLRNFNRTLREFYSDPSKKVEKVKDQLKEATILVDQFQNNLLKYISLELVEGQDVETLAKEVKWFSDDWVFVLGSWLDVFKMLYKREELRPMMEGDFKNTFERFNLSFVSPNSQEDEKSVFAGIVYNTLRLREFEVSYLENGMYMQMLSSPEGLEAMLKFETYLLGSANYYCNSKSKDLLVPTIDALAQCFNKKDFSSNEKYLKTSCFEKEGKVLFPVILDFLKKLAQREIPQKDSKILMEDNLTAVFGFFEEFYKFYGKYTKDQVAELDKTIEELKNKKEKAPAAEGEAVEEEVKQEVKVETEDKEKATEGKEVVKEVEIDPADVEAEKKERIENFKNELQKYIDAVVQCQQHHLVNLKELFTLGEEFNVVIPRDYWTKLYQQAEKNLAAYLSNLLQDSDLKGKLGNIEKPENEMRLKDISKYKAVNQVYQLDFLYQCLEELFIKEIIEELSLNKDLIQGLLMVTKETFQSLTLDDLVLLRKEKECPDFPEVLNDLISRVSKLAINYIVSHVLENNCQLSEDDKLLSVCLDLTEGVFSAQKSILHGLRQDVFSGSNRTCYRDTICLMNAILRANKSLRVEFINRGLLQMLLTVERLSPLKTDEAMSVLCLMTTLLEDSLVLDSQVDLVLKGISKKQEKGEISLEELMQDKNFKPFQNYKRVLEKLKLYGIKSNAENGKSDLSEKDFLLLLPKESDLVENVQKNLSPVAEECVQILLKSLIENYSFDKISSASLQRVKEEKDSKRLKELNTRGKLPKGYLYFRDLPQVEEENYETNVYLDNDSNRTVIQKETGSLVVILSGILSNYPHLIPSVIFQELSVEDTMKQVDNDPDLLSSFKSNSRWSVLDVVLRLVLLKEGSSAVFLIASLIQDNVITSAKEGVSLELKYILLIKVFEILEDILDSEERQGKALETLNSVFMRRNIATIAGFISNEINKDGEPSLGSHKEEILQLIKRITRKLLQNPQMIAYSMQDSYPNNSVIRIISNTVKQNTSKSIPTEELADNYANILKALKTRGPYEPKTFQVDLKNAFEKNLSVKKESKSKISREDQKKFEMWEEKSQFAKEEAQKLFEIAGLKDKELINEIRLPAYGDISIGDINLNSIFSEHQWLSGIENLYKPLGTIRGKPFRSDNKAKLDYILNRVEASKDFGNYQKDNTQSFGAGNIDSDTLLPLLKADTKKIETLKNDTINM